MEARVRGRRHRSLAMGEHGERRRGRVRRAGKTRRVALLAPPEPGEVAAAVEQLAGRKLLQGIRGGPPVDIGALARIVDSVAGLLVDDPMVAEVDCNPVMVCKGKPLVVDALVVLADDAGA